MSELSVGTLSGLAANSYVVDIASGSNLDLSNATDLPASALPAGSIVDVKSVVKTDTFSSSLASGANATVTDLSITHALSNASNKLLLIVSLGIVANSQNKANTGVAVSDGTNLLQIGDAASARIRVTATGRTPSTDAEATLSHGLTVVHLPGDTSSRTYTVRAINVGGATQTVYVNRSAEDSDFADRPRGASSFVLMEVAG